MLKNSRAIPEAIVSFNLAGAGGSGSSNALFGGIDYDQIEGGKGALMQFKTIAYR